MTFFGLSLTQEGLPVDTDPEKVKLRRLLSRQEILRAAERQIYSEFPHMLELREAAKILESTTVFDGNSV